MKTLFVTLITLIISIGFIQAQKIHHNLEVTVSPQDTKVTVIDKISFSKDDDNTLLTFTLNDIFKVKASSAFRLIAKDELSEDGGMDRTNTKEVTLNKYAINTDEWDAENNVLTIEYEGIVPYKIETNKEDYQRGFSEAPGIVSNEGIYLAGSTAWVPQFDQQMVTFEMHTQLPKDWKSVSQGAKLENEGWNDETPQEEIFLIAGPFTEYTYNVGNVTAMAFLRTKDDAMASKYLETTAQYLEMYRGLLGQYPYTKFALVENFWETGYGMPSFTLLGEQIIRFPFILHSSYPHELLHNWWGNSVYVDFDRGNWCEGMTAYLADHLIKEQRGQGANYRRSTLQKYTDYVTPQNDFPLTKFLSRHDGPSEAIGYGKTMMLFHMLRQKVGEENFVRALNRFYRDNKFKRVSFQEIQTAFEETTGLDLQSFFVQWTTRKGAPKLALSSVEINGEKGQYAVEFTLQQLQKTPAFSIEVPVVIQTDQNIYRTTVAMNQITVKYTEHVVGEVLSIAVDPDYDVFRLLDPHEVPPALSGAYGADETLLILPTLVDESKSAIYGTFAKEWKESHNGVTIVKDITIRTLPTDKAVWILGPTNQHASKFNTLIEKYNTQIGEQSIEWPKKSIPLTGQSTVMTIQNPENLKNSIVFIALDRIDAVAGMVRKLPHYGKYSYLSFEGVEPTNNYKGQWPIIQSPLIKTIRNGQSPAQLDERKALAYLAPAFSEDRMMASIEYLASPALKGRGLGTTELDEAAYHIADAFKKYGLISGVDDGSYLQKWTQDVKGLGKTKLQNVIGYIKGSDVKFKDHPIVISAHYDHLGMGWPDVHKGDENKIHYGADDNASGVAILIELAKSLGKSGAHLRPIVFVAFTGEEAGLLGSRYFVTNDGAVKWRQTFANVNMDTDGSLFDKKILVLNANTAKEWKFIFMGTDYVTGIKTDCIEKSLDASDQVAFIENGIPAVQLFTGATEHYHKPSDKVEEIDGPGLVKVATVTKEVITYLADRDRPMPFTGQEKKAEVPTSDKPKKSRRASTGCIPDFGYSGQGVKVDVSADSPAAKAGIQKGDIIMALDDQKVDNLRTYSDILKKRSPGDSVKLTVLRGEEVLDFNFVLKAR